jgi:hypothetical protein
MATHAQRGSFWRVGAGALLIAAALCGGCSALFHVDAKQCTTTSDCAARGTAFTGYTCNQGTCIAPECTKNADCTAFGAGFTCNTKFACVAPVAMLDGGAEAQADAGVDAGGCSTNKDCPSTDPMHPEVACNVDTRTCLQLTSLDCPTVIGEYRGRDMGFAPPIFLGSFVTFPQSGGPLTHPTYLNYLLALNEFQVQSSGVPAGPGTGYRMPVAIACSIDGNIDNAMTHLINDVHVPSIVAPLAAATLSYAFTTYAAPNNVFVINPLGADSTLIALQTNQLLWHMLGQPSDNAPAYGAFLPLIESYVRANPPWNLGPSPMKVATVTANSTVTNDLAFAVKKVLTWNGGQTITQNGSNYLDVLINGSTLNGTPLSDATLAQSITDAAQNIADYQPDVIISFASEEFTTLVQDVELDWMAGPVPFYIAGPYNMGSNNLQSEVSNVPFNTKRFAGIGVASAPPAYAMVLSDYENRFLLANKGRENALGEENYYDAMYFAVDSLVAAGRIPNLGGPDIATGMTHLISLNSTPYQVGPVDQGNIFSVVGGSVQGSIELIGTLGAPNFNPVTGARIGAGDVYCFQDQDAGTAIPKFGFDYDVLRLVNSDGGAPPDASAFQGTFPCYPGIQQ